MDIRVVKVIINPQIIFDKNGHYNNDTENATNTMTNNRKRLTWRVKALAPIFYALLRFGLSFSSVTLD